MTKLTFTRSGKWEERKAGTLDFEVGLPGGGIDDGYGFSRGRLFPLAVGVILVDITVNDIGKNSSPCHSRLLRRLVDFEYG